MRRPKTVSWLAAVCAVSLFAPVPAGAERYFAPDRLVVIGDVHGAHDELVALLGQIGLIDANGGWSGGETHLVSLGDLFGRGPDGRAVIELLMRLESEARAAGGAVHMVLGNHDLMVLTGDLRYIGTEAYAAYVDAEPPGRREAAREAYVAAGGTPESFDSRYPPGYFGHRALFAPQGRYGAWLMERPYVLVIGEYAFVHGGLAPVVSLWGQRRVNREFADAVEDYLEVAEDFEEALGVAAPLGFYERMDLAAQRSGDRASERLLKATQSLPFATNGVVWYREQSLCYPLGEEHVLEQGLEELGAKRAIVGHTPTPTRRVLTRFDGRLIMADTGMYREYFGGTPSALVIEGDDIAVHYLGDEGVARPEPHPRMVGARPPGLDDDALEVWLAEAAVVDVEDVGEGVTKPQRVTLEKDGVQLRALFKTEATPLEGSRRQMRRLIENSDRHHYEIAAYRLDRLLGLDMVPVTIEREIRGRKGALQFWVDGTTSWLKMKEQGITPDGWCPFETQLEQMEVFDTLVYNTDRTQQNMLFIEDEWMLVLIDHSRAFRTDDDVPDGVNRDYLKVRGGFADALAALEHETVSAALGSLLEREQIRAILERRDLLLARYRE